MKLKEVSEIEKCTNEDKLIKILEEIGDKVIFRGYQEEQMIRKYKTQQKVGDKKIQVSHEAFAGYFEYIVMNISAGIDPAKKVLPQTIKALEKMMEAI